jgi:hypothetical protein
MKTYGEVEVKIRPFSSSLLNGGNWSASRSGRPPPKERNPMHPLDIRLGEIQIQFGHGGEYSYRTSCGRQ